MIFGGTSEIQTPFYDYYIFDMEKTTGEVNTIEKKELKVEEKETFIKPWFYPIVY